MIDIVDNQALAELCEDASKSEYITLDTEFIRERTFFPILALVQISWADRAPVLIDPLKITDWEPFHRLLLDPNIVKVFHSGRQDLEIFFFQMKAMPVNIFDTQIAASMCGLGDQIGYSSLVDRLLSVKLAKGSSYTNWLQRPLSDAQLSYARDDVLYLPAVYLRLVKLAREKGRISWIEQEMKDQLCAKLFEPDPNQLWRKVKKASSLRGRNLAVLQAFARWRYEIAQEMDKPLRFVLSDEVMVEVCKLDRLTPEQLRARRGIQSRIIERHGETLSKLHAEAKETPRDQWPVLHPPDQKPPSDKSEALADLAWMLVKELARNAQMAPSHLANKKTLAQFIECYHREGDLSRFEIGKGWRWEMVGQQLIDLMEGRLTIKVKNRRIYWEKES